MKFYLLIQGPFDKIQGQLWKIQGLFKALSKFFNFQQLFKGLMLFQVLFKTCANHVLSTTELGSSPFQLNTGNLIRTSRCIPC